MNLYKLMSIHVEESCETIEIESKCLQRATCKQGTMKLQWLEFLQTISGDVIGGGFHLGVDPT